VAALEGGRHETGGDIAAVRRSGLVVEDREPCRVLAAEDMGGKHARGGPRHIARVALPVRLELEAVAEVLAVLVEAQLAADLPSRRPCPRLDGVHGVRQTGDPPQARPIGVALHPE
jgi:hypothetical protein